MNQFHSPSHENQKLAFMLSWKKSFKKKHSPEKKRSGMLPELLTGRTKEPLTHTHTHTHKDTDTETETEIHTPTDMHCSPSAKTFLHRKLFFIFGLDTSSGAGNWIRAPLWNQQLYSNVICPPPLYLCSLSPFSELCPTQAHTNTLTEDEQASDSQKDRERER